MSDLRGIVTSDNDIIKPIGKVFDAFFCNLTTYVERTGCVDIPHYHNERATLSMFSAACWQCGTIALEEYVTVKGLNEHQRIGRCDLWVLLDENGWEFEAKQLFPDLAVKDTDVSKVLEQAAEAASHNYDSECQAGLTFFTPSVPKGTSRLEVEELLKRLLTIATRRGCHGLAWWFPELLMHRHSPLRRDRSREYIWPGVLTVVEVVRPLSFSKIHEGDVSI